MCCIISGVAERAINALMDDNLGDLAPVIHSQLRGDLVSLHPPACDAGGWGGVVEFGVAVEFGAASGGGGAFEKVESWGNIEFDVVASGVVAAGVVSAGKKNGGLSEEKKAKKIEEAAQAAMGSYDLDNWHEEWLSEAKCPSQERWAELVSGLQQIASLPKALHEDNQVPLSMASGVKVQV